MITKCPNCETKWRVNDNRKGVKAGCPKCKKVFRIVNLGTESTPSEQSNLEETKSEACPFCMTAIGKPDNAILYNNMLVCEDCYSNSVAKSAESSTRSTESTQIESDGSWTCPNCNSKYHPIIFDFADPLGRFEPGGVFDCHNCEQILQIQEFGGKLRLIKLPAWSEEECFSCKKRPAEEVNIMHMERRLEVPYSYKSGKMVMSRFILPVPRGRYYRRFRIDDNSDRETDDCMFWLKVSVLIPRCSRCRMASEWVSKPAFVGAYASGIVAMTGILVRAESWDNVSSGLVWLLAFAAAFIGWVAGYFIIGTISCLCMWILVKAHILSEEILANVDETQFPAMKELIEQGWN